MKIKQPVDDKLTSGNHHSYWIDSMPPLEYATLDSDKTTDVLVIAIEDFLN